MAIKTVKDISNCNSLEDIPALEKLLGDTAIELEALTGRIVVTKNELIKMEEVRISLQASKKRISNRITSIRNNSVRLMAFAKYPNVNEVVKEKVWSKAYEREHSSGEQEVVNYFDDLMEIFD